MLTRLEAVSYDESHYRFYEGNHVRGQLLWVLLLFSSSASAYPSFIGYGYTTCIVCHFNSQGGGALTDYGRALFSQEIAARPWISKKLSDEDLAALSSFIPGKELPYWFRPSAKYRGLYLELGPRSRTASSMWIDMQMDLGVTLSWDRAYKSIAVLTYGNLQKPRDYYGYGEEVSWVSREHYLRTYVGRSLLVAVGLMDKVFGIRTVDHTAYSRKGIGFGQENQSHGVLVEWMNPKFDAAFNYFEGNLLQNEKQRQKGFSFLTEYEIANKNRVGISGASFENTPGVQMTLASVHDRMGFDSLSGASLLGEFGFVDKKIAATSKNTQGTYAYLEGTMPLARGYNFMTSLERSQEDNNPSSMDRQRWTLGFLTFPFQRVELRTSMVQQKGYADGGGEEDAWQFQGQVHVSL